MNECDTRDRALGGTERKYLRGLAHALQPLVHVGRAGVDARVVRALDQALADHELVKVKISADRDERARMTSELAAAASAEAVGSIGTISIFYRAHSDPARRRISLPGRSRAVEASPALSAPDACPVPDGRSGPDAPRPVRPRNEES